MKRASQGVLVLLFALALVMGCSQKNTGEQQAAAPQTEQAQPSAAEQAQPASAQPQPMEQQQAAMPVAQEQAPAQAAPVAQAAEISGTVVKTENGIALFSDSGNFMVDGQQLDQLVGKNVKVTATMAEGAEKPTITVLSVSVIE
jgi:hypothetical protein